jgi:hypothetical protein
MHSRRTTHPASMSSPAQTSASWRPGVSRSARDSFFCGQSRRPPGSSRPPRAQLGLIRLSGHVYCIGSAPVTAHSFVGSVAECTPSISIALRPDGSARPVRPAHEPIRRTSRSSCGCSSNTTSRHRHDKRPSDTRGSERLEQWRLRRARQEPRRRSRRWWGRSSLRPVRPRPLHPVPQADCVRSRSRATCGLVSSSSSTSRTAPASNSSAKLLRERRDAAGGIDSGPCGPSYLPSLRVHNTGGALTRSKQTPITASTEALRTGATTLYRC